MRTNRILIGLVLCAFWSPVFATPVAGMTPPDQVVRQTVMAMFSAVDTKRAELKQHPAALYSLISKILLPHFDLGYSSELVLGPYWRNATPAQRQAFETAFFRFLMHSYSNSLLKGSYSMKNLVVEPWRGRPTDSHAVVRSELRSVNGAAPLHVDYLMVHTAQGWQAFDVSIEGISYVMNYRNQFAPEIKQTGIDALIKRLNTESRGAAVAPAHGSGH